MHELNRYYLIKFNLVDVGCFYVLFFKKLFNILRQSVHSFYF